MPKHSVPLPHDTAELVFNVSSLNKEIGRLTEAVERLDSKVDNLDNKYATQRDLNRVESKADSTAGDIKKVVISVILALIGALITFFFAFAQRGLQGGG